MQRRHWGEERAVGRKSGCCQVHGLRILEPQEGPASPCPAGVCQSLCPAGPGGIRPPGLRAVLSAADTRVSRHLRCPSWRLFKLNSRAAGVPLPICSSPPSGAVHSPLCPVRLAVPAIGKDRRRGAVTACVKQPRSNDHVAFGKVNRTKRTDELRNQDPQAHRT